MHKLISVVMWIVSLSGLAAAIVFYATGFDEPMAFVCSVPLFISFLVTNPFFVKRISVLNKPWKALTVGAVFIGAGVGLAYVPIETVTLYNIVVADATPGKVSNYIYAKPSAVTKIGQGQVRATYLVIQKNIGKDELATHEFTYIFDCNKHVFKIAAYVTYNSDGTHQDNPNVQDEFTSDNDSLMAHYACHYPKLGKSDYLTKMDEGDLKRLGGFNEPYPSNLIKYTQGFSKALEATLPK